MTLMLTFAGSWLAAFWQRVDVWRCCGSFGPTLHRKHRNNLSVTGLLMEGLGPRSDSRAKR